MGVVLVYKIAENLIKLPLKVYNVHFSHTVSLEDCSWRVMDDDSNEVNFGMKDGTCVKGSLIKNAVPPPMLLEGFEDLDSMRG